MTTTMSEFETLFIPSDSCLEVELGSYVLDCKNKEKAGNSGPGFDSRRFRFSRKLRCCRVYWPQCNAYIKWTVPSLIYKYIVDRTHSVLRVARCTAKKAGKLKINDFVLSMNIIAWNQIQAWKLTKPELKKKSSEQSAEAFFDYKGEFRGGRIWGNGLMTYRDGISATEGYFQVWSVPMWVTKNYDKCL